MKHLTKQIYNIWFLSLFLFVFLSACVGGQANLTSRELVEGYQWAVETYFPLLEGAGTNWKDTRLQPGPINVAFVPIDGDLSPNWNRRGSIKTCGAGLCFASSDRNQSIPLRAIKASRGIKIGFGSGQDLNGGGGYRFIDGNLMFWGARGSRSIGVWYQTSGQAVNAIRLYATLANQVRTVHQKRGDMKAADAFSNGADAVMGALATLPSTNSYSPPSNNFNQYALRVQEQERQKEQHRQKIVAEHNANELEQRRRYEAEKQADLAVRAQTEKNRLAEERRAMEDLRSRSQNGEAQCRLREIACSTPASCNSAYMSLPICNY